MKAKSNRRTGEVVMEVGRCDERLLAAAATAEFQIKRILVPLDFSGCSSKALRYAIALARQHGAALDLLYVVATPPYGSGESGPIDFGNLQQELEESAAEELRKTITREIANAVPAGPIIRTGAAAHEIVDVAESLPADLIVISTHGRTGLKHVLLGSVAEHVVRHAPCPVLVVREREHEFLKAEEARKKYAAQT